MRNASRLSSTSLSIALLVAMCLGCERGEPRSGGVRPHAPEEILGVQPLPDALEVPVAQRELGRRLFFDPRLSGDGSLSCASCHRLDHGGAEPERTSTGIDGQRGPINAPTVLNSSYQFRQFWDGRAADLREQAGGPITNPLEMGSSWDRVLETLRADPSYVHDFEAVYVEGISEANVRDAIARYEDGLVTPSRFDDWLRGDESAISRDEREGFDRFRSFGCVACHGGILLGGTSFQKLGVVHDYFAERGTPETPADLGRYNVTQREEDRHFFKVPTLRNVERTAPYFHDGSRATLDEAVQAMGHYQLGRELSAEDTRLVIAFLRSLTGRIPDSAWPPGQRPSGGR